MGQSPSKQSETGDDPDGTSLSSSFSISSTVLDFLPPNVLRHLQRFASEESLRAEDPIWNSLCSLAIPLIFTQNDFVQVQNISDELLKPENFIASGNLATAVQVYLQRQMEIYSAAECGNVIYLRQVRNLLFIIRQVINSTYQDTQCRIHKNHLQDGSPTMNNAVFDILMLFGERRHLFKDYVFSLANLTTNIDCFEITYELHLELLMSLTTLMSEQMLIPMVQTPLTAFNNIIGEIPSVMCKNMIKKWIQFILLGVAGQTGAELIDEDSLTSIGGHFTARVVGCTRSSVTNVTDVTGTSMPVDSNISWLSYLNPFRMLYTPSLSTHANFAASQSSAHPNASKPAAEVMLPDLISLHSLVLVLMIANQRIRGPDSRTSSIHTTSALLPTEIHIPDPYKHLRKMIFKFSHIGQMKEPKSFELDLQRLYKWLSRNQHQEPATLLLYTLIHQNSSVKAYILSRMDLDTIVIPVLRLLYSANKKSSHHVYMALIILLMLSEDDGFAKSIHEIVVPMGDLKWYRERVLVNCTLGSLILLVLTRTIHYNMTKLRDQYLHTNCIATLGNLANKLQQVHPYAAQRYMALFQSLSKKHSNSNDPKEQAVVRNVLKLLMNVLAVALRQNITANVQLVFAILHQKQAFEDLNSALLAASENQRDLKNEHVDRKMSSELLQSTSSGCVFDECEESDEDDDEQTSPRALLQSPSYELCRELLKFYDARIDQLTASDSKVLSAESVCKMIGQTLRVFPRQILIKGAIGELKFSYIEEEHPEEFFIPYVWHMCYTHCRIYWKPDAIRLFNL